LKRAWADGGPALHPETRHGAVGNGREKSCQVGDSTPDRFTADTAKKTGQSERVVQRDASRAERVDPGVLATIAENLHRAELTVLERSEHIAEWVRLTENDEFSDNNVQKLSVRGRVGEGRPEGGINAAVRELGIDRTEAQRAVKLAKLSDEAKDTATVCYVASDEGGFRAASNPNSIRRRAASARGGMSNCLRRHSSISSLSSGGRRNSKRVGFRSMEDLYGSYGGYVKYVDVVLTIR